MNHVLAPPQGSVGQADLARAGLSHRPPESEFVTQTLVQEAVGRVLPMLEAASHDEEVCGTGFLSIAIMSPVLPPHVTTFEEALLWEHHIGDPKEWDADYGAFARAKARLSWQSARDSRCMQSLPHLLRQGDSLLVGGVSLDGIVVGVSGAQPWYDEAFALAVASMIRALAFREHARMVSTGRPTASFQS